MIRLWLHLPIWLKTVILSPIVAALGALGAFVTHPKGGDNATISHTPSPSALLALQ